MQRDGSTDQKSENIDVLMEVRRRTGRPRNENSRIILKCIWHRIGCSGILWHHQCWLLLPDGFKCALKCVT